MTPSGKTCQACGEPRHLMPPSTSVAWQPRAELLDHWSRVRFGFSDDGSQRYRYRSDIVRRTGRIIPDQPVGYLAILALKTRKEKTPNG